MKLGLENRLKQPVNLLSGGQRQSLTLLMATLSLPKLLLMDEHTAALDPKTAIRVMKLTAEVIKQNQLTAIMVTHNMEQAIKYGNRLIMLHEGRVQLDIRGTEKECFTVEEAVKRFGSTLKDETLLSCLKEIGNLHTVTMRIITTHRNADFDALASVMAVRILFPDAIPVLPKQVNPNVKAFLSIHKDVFSTYTFEEVDLDLVEQLVVVDTNQWERLEGMAGLKTRNDLEIQLWDHHPIRGNIITPWKVCESHRCHHHPVASQNQTRTK